MTDNLENKLDNLPQGNLKSFAKGFGKELIQSAYTLFTKKRMENVGDDARDRREYQGMVWGSVAFLLGTLGGLIYLGNLATRVLVDKYSSN